MLSAAGKGAFRCRLLYLVPEISRSSRSIGSPRPKEPQRLERLECIEDKCAFGVGQSKRAGHDVPRSTNSTSAAYV